MERVRIVSGTYSSLDPTIRGQCERLGKEIFGLDVDLSGLVYYVLLKETNQVISLLNFEKGYLYNVCTAVQFQRRGAASLLLEAFLADNNPRPLWLTVWEQNTGAIIFYQRHGFEVVRDGIKKNSRGEPEKYLVMCIPPKK